MSYPAEQLIVLYPVEGNGFDIGNTGANVANFVLPVKCVVERVLCWSNTAVANSFTVSFDSYNRTTQGAEDIGKIIVPDSTAARAPVFDDAGNGQILDAGEQVLVQVDEAGDSGEEAFVALVVRYQPEYKSNQTLISETA